MKSKAERLKIQNEMMALLEDAKAIALQLPNVIDVAIGLKEKKGKLTKDIVFQVFVIEKISKSALSSSTMVPKTLMGHPTDVIIVPKGRKRVDRSEHRPLTGGVQISNGKGHVGTLGCFAKRLSDDKLLLLTNEHVLFSDGAQAGEKIGQPTVENNCCCCCAYTEGVIGTILTTNFNNTSIDCAIATIDPKIAIDHILTNSMTTSELRIEGTSIAVVGDLVRKVGRTSGLTNGIVNSINGTVFLSDGTTINKSGQIFIRPVDSESFTEGTNNKKAFSDGGDSGSIIIDEFDEVIGLLWGGDPDTFSVDETYACHIDDVLDAFSDAGSAISIIATPADRSKTAIRRQLQPKRIDIDIRERLLETAIGKILVPVFELHQKEVLQLINHNRQAKVAWQRQQGPAFTAHLVKSYKDKSHLIPKQVKGITLPEMLTNMAMVLKQNGSRDLRLAIEQHALQIIQESYGLKNIADYLDRISTQHSVLT